ncbi:hypothetical protein Thermo_01969 [Thermoplasmatales archaeon]|nr:hypothetical protein Thermo_01969 [Thermoplasmatales archaeon]
MPEIDSSVDQDIRDLLAVLELRFGEIDTVYRQKLIKMTDFSLINRLILVAANAPSLDIFLAELNSPEMNFKIVGEDYDPLFKKR